MLVIINKKSPGSSYCYAVQTGTNKGTKVCGELGVKVRGRGRGQTEDRWPSFTKRKNPPICVLAGQATDCL